MIEKAIEDFCREFTMFGIEPGFSALVLVCLLSLASIPALMLLSQFSWFDRLTDKICEPSELEQIQDEVEKLKEDDQEQTI